MTKRRLLVLAAVAALVLIVAVAVVLDSWQVALVAVAVLQAGALAIALDARAKVALAIARNARAEPARASAISQIKKQLDDVGTKLSGIGKQIDNVGKRTLATLESSRLEATDRGSNRDQQFARIHEQLAKLQSQDIDGQLASIGKQIDNLGERTLARLDQRSNGDEQLARMREQLAKLQSRDTDERLARIGEQVAALQPQLQEGKLTAIGQVRQIEALMQLFRRVEPRAAMPPSGGWALDATNILAMLDLVETRRPRLVVELGSGTSSIWLGYALEQIGSAGRLVSFESDSGFAALAEAQVRKHALDNTVEIRSTRLVASKLRGHETPWYDTQAFDDIDGIDLLIVDGPSKDTGPMSRYPALPNLISHMSDQGTVALDDAKRPDEERIVRRWLAETPGLREVRSAPDDTLTVLDRMPQTRFFR